MRQISGKCRGKIREKHQGVASRRVARPGANTLQGVPLYFCDSSTASDSSMWIEDPLTGEVRLRKRRRRFDQDRMPRELTFSCYHRFKFVERDQCRVWFREAIEITRVEWPIDLWAYVIMPEHVHLIVAPRKSNVEVGRFAGKIKERVSRQAVKWLALNSPTWLEKISVTEGGRIRHRFWQPGGGYDRNVDQVETLRAMIDYIHLNPVRRGLVEKTVDWEWSSARWYNGSKSVWIEMDDSIREVLT